MGKYSLRDCRKDVAGLIEAAKKEPKDEKSQAYIDGLTMAFNHIRAVDVEEVEEDTYMTNRQLAELLAQGYGQVKLVDDEDDIETYIDSYWTYGYNEDDNDLVPSNAYIRKWGEDRWTKALLSIYTGFIVPMRASTEGVCLN